MGHTCLTTRPDEDIPDVLLHLSGGEIEYIFKKPIKDLAHGAYKIAWVYSHPEKVTPTSLKGYDKIFCCSEKFAQKMRDMGYEVETMLGATNKKPLNLPVVRDVAFVGTSRGPGGRPAVAALMECPPNHNRIQVWGFGLDKHVPPQWFGGRYYPYEELSTLYASSKIVLQDHRPEMAREGFVSVKLYDILASGSLPVCAIAQGVKDLFGDAIPQYDSPAHLRSIIDYYCEHEDERQVLIARGQQIAMKSRWVDRARQILREVRG
jgi:hypothetical protein